MCLILVVIWSQLAGTKTSRTNLPLNKWLLRESFFMGEKKLKKSFTFIAE